MTIAICIFFVSSLGAGVFGWVLGYHVGYHEGRQAGLSENDSKGR